MPSERDIRAAKIKQARRHLLDTLNLLGETWASFATIAAGMACFEVGDDLIRRDLHYMIQKGYVEVTYPEWDPASKCYRLTASGNERANAILKDPALEA